jgi:hypothetical protein
MQTVQRDLYSSGAWFRCETSFCAIAIVSHAQGFSRIQNLDEYTGLKVIWLEGNGLSKIEGLDCQLELSTLYLQENIIERIENLGHLSRLNTVNLSKVRAPATRR